MDSAAHSLALWRHETARPHHGLPAGAYTDEAFFARECGTVFRDGWVLAGFAHTLAEPGCVQPATVGRAPVLLVRNETGIVAFHNVCRHRCLKLVETPRNVGKAIRCPYHAWAYDLEGRLRAAPHFGGIGVRWPEGFDPAEHGLVPVRCHLWHDWIFVNLGGKAPPFETYAAPLIARLEGIDFSQLVPVATLDFGEVATNWKLLMENFIEPYHVQFVHSSTTDQPLKDHATIVDPPCLGSLVDLPEEQASEESLGVSSRYLTLFPSFVLGRYVPNQLGVHHNVPLGPGRTAQRRVIYRTDGIEPDAAEVESLKTLWWKVHKEDHAICERLQAGRASPVAEDGGVLSPCWEDSVRAFQEMVADALTDGGMR